MRAEGGKAVRVVQLSATVLDALLEAHWSELATLENAVLALDPIKRTVPTTSTKITANITAYSAIS